jgi:hypothetical protein
MPHFHRFIVSLSLLLFSELAVLPMRLEAREHRPSSKEVDAAAVRSIQTYQPPPADSLQVYCEPIRLEVVRLSRQSFIPRLFSGPRRAWLVRKHRDCKHRIMDQEYTYLKHVDIQQAPQLPSLKTQPEAPADTTLPTEEKTPAGSVGPAPDNTQSEPAKTNTDRPEPTKFEFKIPIPQKTKPAPTKDTEIPSTPAKPSEPSHAESR